MTPREPEQAGLHPHDDSGTQNVVHPSRTTNGLTRRVVDQVLLRRLQGQLGALRQSAIDQRRAQGLPPLEGEDEIQHGKAMVRQVVTDYEAALVEVGGQQLPWEAHQDLVDALEARLFGAGSLQQLLEDERVENIDINGYRNVFVEFADGQVRRVPPVTSSDEDLVEQIQLLAAHEGLSSRAFDVANPQVNLRLADGSRLHAVQGVTPFPAASIRKHRYPRLDLSDLVELGTIDAELCDLLTALVRGRKNVMIGGATGAGKTTTARALASVIDPAERLITVERTLELGLHDDAAAHPNTVPMEERLANSEGVGAVTMRDLVQCSLRMNPSRVIVGEVLGAEAIDMLNAMNQGNDGSLSTIHANSSADVVNKIATYALQAPERLPWAATISLVAGGLDFVVFMRRVRTAAGQHRFVESVREITGVTDGQLESNEVWGRDPAGVVRRRSAVQLACHDDLVDVGWHPVVESAPVSAGERWV